MIYFHQVSAFIRSRGSSPVNLPDTLVSHVFSYIPNISYRCWLPCLITSHGDHRKAKCEERARKKRRIEISKKREKVKKKMGCEQKEERNRLELKLDHAILLIKHTAKYFFNYKKLL